MRASVKLCKFLNSFFPLPVHPFNLQNDKIMKYSQWQFEKGKETIKFYLARTTMDDMFRNKVVLDIGCGAAGKTLFYASQGAKKVYGVDVVERYRNEANELAEEKGLEDRFEFVLASADKTDFEDGFFDTIIMNDAMEHVDEPEKVLEECYRILKPSGKLYINFPPYYHPYGAHLSDAVGIPWVHAFFSDKTLIEVYKDLVKDLPDGKDRVEFRISADEHGEEYFSYLNKMTVDRYNKILRHTPFKQNYYSEVPLRGFLSPISGIPGFKEFFVKMVVTILEK